MFISFILVNKGMQLGSLQASQYGRHPTNRAWLFLTQTIKIFFTRLLRTIEKLVFCVTFEKAHSIGWFQILDGYENTMVIVIALIHDYNCEFNKLQLFLDIIWSCYIFFGVKQVFSYFSLVR